MKVMRELHMVVGLTLIQVVSGSKAWIVCLFAKILNKLCLYRISNREKAFNPEKSGRLPCQRDISEFVFIFSPRHIFIQQKISALKCILCIKCFQKTNTFALG
jgi:hypothetical protein